MNTVDEIHRLAQQHGLVVCGGFVVDDADNVPCIDEGVARVTLVLFGNADYSLWDCFSNSREYADGLPDPIYQRCVDQPCLSAYVDIVLKREPAGKVKPLF